MFGTILWAGLMFLIAAVAAGFVLVGCVLLKPTLRAGRDSTSSTAGEITELERVEGDEEVLYYPVFRFRAGGRDIRVRSLIGWGGRTPYRVGQAVTVYFPPERPEEARLSRFEGIGFSLVVLTVGSAFLVASLYELLRLVT